MNKSLIAATAIVLAAGANAQTLVLYHNFNDTTNATTLLTPSVNLVSSNVTVTGWTAAATLSNPGNGNYGHFAGTTFNARNSDPAGQALVVVGTNGNGGTVVFSMSSLGLADLNLKAATRRTGTGYNDIDIDYRVNGGTWNSLVANYNTNSSGFTGVDVDVMLPQAASNQSNLEIRFTYSGATGATGNSRLDNLTIEATPVPEPASMIALGVGLVALARRRNRK